MANCLWFYLYNILTVVYAMLPTPSAYLLLGRRINATCSISFFFPFSSRPGKKTEAKWPQLSHVSECDSLVMMNLPIGLPHVGSQTGHESISDWWYIRGFGDFKDCFLGNILNIDWIFCWKLIHIISLKLSTNDRCLIIWK